jgi:hypothetical protein
VTLHPVIAGTKPAPIKLALSEQSRVEREGSLTFLEINVVQTAQGGTRCPQRVGNLGGEAAFLNSIFGEANPPALGLPAALLEAQMFHGLAVIDQLAERIDSDSQMHIHKFFGHQLVASRGLYPFRHHRLIRHQ